MTEDPVLIPEVLHEAARIFLGELRDHAVFFKTVSGDLTKHAAPLAERFHLIKGGAGFLKLTTLRDSASAAEKVFRAKELDLAAARKSFENALPIVEETIAGLSRELAADS